MSFWRRWQLARRVRRCPDNHLQALYQSQLTELDKPLNQARLLAVDLEMTGLNPQQDSVLSIGWVPIDGAIINLHGATHRLIKSHAEVGDSATIHGIKDSDKATGQDIAIVLAEFLRACQGRVLLFHHARLDVAFLDKMLKQVDPPIASKFRPLVVDTLVLEQKKMLRHTSSIPTNALRLLNCRERYHLPAYGNHNALTDALSTAELFLAMTAGQGERLLLGNVGGFS